MVIPLDFAIILEKSFNLELIYPLILASTSPRRQELMAQIGYKFTIIPPPYHEPDFSPSPAQTALAWAQALAYFKARAIAQTNPEAIVIGADTIVTHNDTIIGKPRDKQHARQILTTMFGGKNEVITGLAVLCPARNKRIITYENSTLVMRPMKKEEVNTYLASGAWRGKAGAYALQEGGDKFVQSIEGSESNIVGLPLEKLREVLSFFEK